VIGGTTMDGEQHNMTLGKAYEELCCYTIVENEVKLEALFGPS
jgi:hypothetical protein